MSLFQVGSVTKSLTASLLALLADEGVLGWDDTLADHLADELELPPALRPITLRQLATHGAGLPREPVNRRDLADSPSVMLPYSVRELYEVRAADGWGKPYRITMRLIARDEAAYEDPEVVADLEQGLQATFFTVDEPDLLHGEWARLLIESAGEQGQSRFRDIPEPEEFQSLVYRVREERSIGLTAAGQKDPAAQLETLSRLHRDGVITDAEFEEKKQKLLDQL